MRGYGSEQYWGTRSAWGDVAVGSPSGSDGKASAYNVGDLGSIPGLGRSPEEGNATHSRIIAWKIPLQRSLVGYSPWGCKESDTTERFHFFSHVHHSLAPGKQQGGNTTPPSTENWIKDLLSMTPPIRTKPRFPLSLSHQEVSISHLSFSIRRRTD